MFEFGLPFFIWWNFSKLKLGVNYFMIEFGVFFKLKVWWNFFI